MITLNYINLGKARKRTLGTAMPGFIVSDTGETRYVPGITKFAPYGKVAGWARGRTVWRGVAPTQDYAGSRYLDRPHVIATLLRAVRNGESGRAVCRILHQARR